MTGAAEGWAIVVPVKRLDRAKSRLAVPPAVRRELALAMATDTVEAAVACAAVGVVVVVTDDVEAASVAGRLGAVVVPDEPDAGLNPALRHGAARAEVDGRRPIAALSSDLPALRPDDLASVLHAARQAHVDGATSAGVADADGSGTTLYAAAGLAAFAPSFGPQSWDAHRRAGAVDVTGVAAASVRRDVDTLTDLAAAAGLGCGPATREVLRRHAEVLTAGRT